MLFYDPKQDLSRYRKPPLSLFEDYRNQLWKFPRMNWNKNNQKDRRMSENIRYIEKNRSYTGDRNII